MNYCWTKLQCTEVNQSNHSIAIFLSNPFRKSNRSNHLQIIEEKIQTISGETITRRYSRGRMLGKGGFAKCYEVTNLENKKVLAAKII